MLPKWWNNYLYRLIGGRHTMISANEVLLQQQFPNFYSFYYLNNIHKNVYNSTFCHEL